MLDGNYHRPIQIWCKDRPKWADLGPERDPVRLLMRAAWHLDGLLADMLCNRWLRQEDEFYIERIALVRASATCAELALGLELSHGHADPHDAYSANA